MMSRHIEIHDDKLRIQFTGLTVAASLKKEIEVPLSSIIDVSVGDFEINPLSFRVGTSGIGKNLKHGKFLYQKEWVFLSFTNHRNVLILELQDFPYKKIALETESPEQLKMEIQSALATI